MIPFHSFIDHLRYERRSSAHTVAAYEGDLRQFASYMAEKMDDPELPEIGVADLRTWVLTLLEDRELSPRSVNRKLSALRDFFRFEMKAGRLQHNPMDGLQGPKFRGKLPEYVELGDMERLFRPEMFEDSFEGWRDQTILELFYATGMRLSELLNIRRRDIDFYENSVKVLGKRNKERIIPFGSRMRSLLTKHLENYAEKFAPENDNFYIFVAANGRQLYPKAVYRIVRKYLDMVTTIDKRSPHVIRHTFATHMLNNGADLNAIKVILGHSSLAATQVYTHNSVEQLKSIYKQAHPRA
jgi:integrase/recombinase XerC